MRFRAKIVRIEQEICINFAFRTDELNINEQNTSIATGSLYLYIDFDVI